MNGAASSTGPLALGDLGAVALQNSCTNGEWMVIWDIQIVCVPNPFPNHLIISDLAIGPGMLAGALLNVNNNGPLVSGAPQAFGNTWTHNSPGNEIGNIFNSLTLIPAGNAAYYQWVHEWPVCAIQPGDSVVAYSDADAYEDFGVGYLYEIVPGGISV
jgi:hypothetical protein